jgi:FtsP/CotA-like multicopper oxidase with cupredoxin domain
MRISLAIITLFFIQLSASSQNFVSKLLIARNTGEKVLANDTTIRVFGFAENLGSQPGVPGPTLVVNQGDSVVIDLWNVSQGAPHTIHLHGLDVNQQNDGVPHLSFDVPHMEHGYYFFKAPHAGTYLYHCHVASTIHVQAGMYGLIIVKPTDGSNTTWDGGYAYQKEYAYFMSEIDTTWHRDDVLMHDHDPNQTIHKVEIPTYDPQFFLINGFSDQQLAENDVRIDGLVNETNYLRLANIGFYGVRVILPAMLQAKVVASDGRALPSEEVSDTIVVMPGERYGLLIKASGEFEGNINYEYFSLNTNQVKNTQQVPVKIEGTVGLNDAGITQMQFELAPNPANEVTSVTLDLPINSSVEILITDLQGKLVSTVESRFYNEGEHNISLPIKQLEAGNYFVQLRLNSEYTLIRQLVKQ